MKVALSTLAFPPEAFGGTERVAAALAGELRRSGDEVVVLTTGLHAWPGRDLDIGEWDGTPVYRFYRRDDEWDASGLQRPRLLELVCRTLAEAGSEVVHAHHLAGFGAGLLPWARRRGLGTVLTCHDLWLTCPRYFRAPPAGVTCPKGDDREPCAACVNLDLRRSLAEVRAALAERDRLLRAEVAAARRLTAPSRTAAMAIVEHLPWSGPIDIVPPGLLHRPAGRAGPPAPDERLRVGTFGNLVAEKGVLELVRAAAGLPVEVHLHGPFLDPAFERQVRDTAAELGVALSCHGPYRPEERHPALELHLAVFPSRCRETYGLVVDEALAHGVPALVSEAGAFAERRGQAGVRVVPIDSLAATLAGLARQRDSYRALRDEVPAAGSGPADMAQRYRALYDESLRETR